ncbi:MAG TPA: trypsin-like peptidase domain-containing protein [Kofleriaceae bacterium]|nr:trypsin-like peptidase domain-containing protein [Kofleriaceae bacterium]
MTSKLSIKLSSLFSLSSLSSLLSVATLGLLGACVDQDVAPSEDELAEAQQPTICGRTDDAQYVNDYNGTLGPTVTFVQTHKTSKGALASSGVDTSSKYCSGTLIASNLFLTAGHCVDATSVGDYVAMNYERAAGSTTLLTQSHYRVDAVLEDELGGLDYAIVQLAGTPGATWGIAAVASADPATGAALTIIGHPEGRPKQIEAGTVFGFGTNNIRYNNIDTLGGNSGSGVIDASGVVVGVHTNGGCTRRGGYNYGTRISRIRAVSSIL